MSGIKYCKECCKDLSIDSFRLKSNNEYTKKCKYCLDKYNIHKRNYYMNNPSVGESKKEYHLENKEAIEYRRSEKIKCEHCNREMQRSFKSKHLRLYCHPNTS